MSKFRIIPESETINQLQFMCPGCKEVHSLNNTWSFNNDINNPTISPSILVTWTYAGVPKICHSFITNGKIQFLNDCTHEMSDQTVDLPEIE